MPPSTAPPFSPHDPLAAFNARVVLVLLSVPTRNTEPLVREKFPRFASVKFPPRLTVVLLTLMLDRLLQLPFRLSVELRTVRGVVML